MRRIDADCSLLAVRPFFLFFFSPRFLPQRLLDEAEHEHSVAQNCVGHARGPSRSFTLALKNPNRFLQAEPRSYFETTVQVAACQSRDDNLQAGGSKPPYHLP